MNRHLSSDQITRWMLGERTSEEEGHARECLECAAELARFDAALSLFRDSVRNWSSPDAPRIPAVPRRPRARPLLAAALLCLAALVPVYRNAAERRRHAATLRADALLLEEVNAQISRTVPAPLEPLTKLVSWAPGNPNGQGEAR